MRFAIEAMYNITPVAFTIGKHYNERGTSLTTLIILAFAKHHNLSIENTVPMFCEAYTETLKDGERSVHQNIWALMRCNSLDEVVFHYDHPVITPIPALAIIEEAWEHRDTLTINNISKDLCDAIGFVMDRLANGIFHITTECGSISVINHPIEKARCLAHRHRKLLQP
ncbi:MAG TPA: HopJ type III effector protein [Patescibacteria group bacterium]|nr:HopJ type III effector protein [Patescibacteria group bacterium]